MREARALSCVGLGEGRVTAQHRVVRRLRGRNPLSGLVSPPEWGSCRSRTNTRALHPTQEPHQCHRKCWIDRPAVARRYLGVRPRWHRMDNSARPGVGCPLKAVFGHPTEYETRAGVDCPLKAVFGLNLGCRMTWRATRPRPSVSSMCRLAHCRNDQPAEGTASWC